MIATQLSAERLCGRGEPRADLPVSFRTMRKALAPLAVVAGALLAAPVASANLPSPVPQFRGLHVATVAAHERRTTSCSAERARAGKLERKILPVACEQPPWVNVLGNQHKQAALAIVALLGG